MWPCDLGPILARLICDACILLHLGGFVLIVKLLIPPLLLKQLNKFVLNLVFGLDIFLVLSVLGQQV